MELSPAIFADKYWHSFKGIANLYGIEQLHKFATSQVFVVGVGGVGSWAVESLARTGIGSLVLIDADDICTSNINRQLPALQSSIGEDKTAYLAQRCLDINPLIDVQTHEVFLTEDNMDSLITARNFRAASISATPTITPRTIYIIDAIDNGVIKAKLADFCRRNKHKIVIIGAAGGKFDPTQIKCDDITRTSQDPMLANIRNRLRRNYNYREIFKDKKFNLPCVYSTEQIKLPAQKQACDVKSLNCSNGYGSTTVVTATFANFAVSKILAMIMHCNK